jgi:hypothetical protein
MLKQILKKLAKHLNPRLGLMLMLPLALALIMPDFALAEAPTDPELDVYVKIGTALNLAMSFVQSLLWPFLVFIGDLMDSDLIIGPGMEDRLWSIWVQLRDLVNIVFVIVLLVIAFYNTLGIGGGEGNLAMKTALPKVVLGLILVNFTFVGGKLIIDISNVATTAVFALPELSENFDMEEQQVALAANICIKDANLDTEAGKYAVGVKDTPALTKLFCEMDDEKKYYTGALSAKAEKDYFQRLNKSNISIVMASNMGAMNKTELLKPGAISDFESLLENMTFSVVMTLIFAISYIVLGLVLISRVVVLWLALAFSPVAVLIFVVPQLKELVGGGGDIVDKVVKHLIAPIIIGTVMSIGYVMIDAWEGVVGGSYLSIAGAEADELLATEVLLTGVSDLSHLIIAVASVVIVWVGVFGAASGTIASMATDGIKSIGENVGKAALKAPLSLASVPVPFYNETTGEMDSQDLSVMDMFNSAKFTSSGLNQNEAASKERLGRVFGKHSMLAGGRAINDSAKASEQFGVISDVAKEDGSLDDNDLRRIEARFLNMRQNGEISDPNFMKDLRTAMAAFKNNQPEALTQFFDASKDKFKTDEAGEEARDEAFANLRGKTYETPSSKKDKKPDTAVKPPAGGGVTPPVVEPPAGGDGGTPPPPADVVPPPPADGPPPAGGEPVAGDIPGAPAEDLTGTTPTDGQ